MPKLVGGAMLVTARVVDPTNGRGGYGVMRIDSGDDIAIIDPSLMNSIGVVPVAHAQVEGIDGQPVTVPVYHIDVDLGSMGYLTNVEAFGLNISGLGYAGLFGDNELNQGVLVRDGPAQTFSFTGTSAVPPSPPSYGMPLAIAAVGLAGVATAALWPRRRG